MILGDGSGLQLPADFSRRERAGVATGFASSVRVAIEDALRATRGKIYGTNGAAARLGLPPGTLQSKMRKLGIERARFLSSG